MLVLAVTLAPIVLVRIITPNSADINDAGDDRNLIQGPHRIRHQTLNRKNKIELFYFTSFIAYMNLVPQLNHHYHYHWLLLLSTWRNMQYRIQWYLLLFSSSLLLSLTIVSISHSLSSLYCIVLYCCIIVNNETENQIKFLISFTTITRLTFFCTGDNGIENATISLQEW